MIRFSEDDWGYLVWTAIRSIAWPLFSASLRQRCRSWRRASRSGPSFFNG